MKKDNWSTVDATIRSYMRCADALSCAIEAVQEHRALLATTVQAKPRTPELAEGQAAVTTEMEWCADLIEAMEEARAGMDATAAEFKRKRERQTGAGEQFADKEEASLILRGLIR